VPTDLLIYGIVAAGLIFWLRSVLGSKHGEERERPNPFTAAPSDAASANVPKSVDGLPLEDNRPKAVLAPNMAISADSTVEEGLAAIARADRDFEPPRFLQGAQDAFVMVVEAFAADDREALKDLLSPPVFTSFDLAIRERQGRGEKSTVDIHAVRKAEIVGAALQGRTAFVTVRFTADETNVLYDREGKILSGNPDRVSETVDVWTFGREVKSRDPSWLLYETKENVE
jgi:predicted lipid-binding transport protein (Tim44 family)